MAIQEVSFTKGFNPATDAFSCPPGFATTFNDVILDYGVIKSRQTSFDVQSGTVDSGTAVGAVYLWAASSATGYFIYAICGSDLFRSTAAFQPGVSVSWNKITNSLSFSTPAKFDSLNGILMIISDGNANTVASNTSNPANQSIPVNAGTCLTANNMMFLSASLFGSGSASTYSTVYWSAVNDLTTWPGGSNLTFRNNDGDYITALGILGSNVLIFKTHSIGFLNTTTQTVSGTVTLGPLTTLFTGVGCIGPDAVANLPDGRCVFVAYDMNVYITDGSILTSLTNGSPPGSPNLRDFLSPYGSGITPNLTVLRYNTFRNEIVVTLYQNTAAAYIMVAYDMIQQYWRQITGFQTLCMTFQPQVGSTTGVPSLLIGDNNGKVIHLEGTLPGTPVDHSASQVSPTFSTSILIPQTIVEGTFLNIVVIYAGGTFTLQYGFDGVYSSNTYTLPTRATGGRYVAKIPLPSLSTSQRPSSLSIKFNGPAGASYQIYKVYISDEVED